MSHLWSYKNLSFVGLALLLAISGIYSLKLFSFLMPVFTLILIWYQGGIKNISFQISPPFIFLFLLLLWAGISVFWAYTPQEALKGYISLNFTFVFSVLFIACFAKIPPEWSAKVSTLVRLTGVF